MKSFPWYHSFIIWCVYFALCFTFIEFWFYQNTLQRNQDLELEKVQLACLYQCAHVRCDNSSIWVNSLDCFLQQRGCCSTSIFRWCYVPRCRMLVKLMNFLVDLHHGGYWELSFLGSNIPTVWTGPKHSEERQARKQASKEVEPVTTSRGLPRLWSFTSPTTERLSEDGRGYVPSMSAITVFVLLSW